MTIELLYFDDCPNHDALLSHLRELLDGLEPAPELVLHRITDDAEAQRERFLGSPTVRVDGRDIDPCADERDDYGMKCRLYQTAAGRAGMPPEEWLLRALTSARWSAAQRARALSPRERELHGLILRAFVAGAAPGAEQLDEWAAGLGLDPAGASAALARHDLVHRDAQNGAISVAYPFSVAKTSHRVRLCSGVEMFAMCAIDALGIAFMLREPTEIVSADPATGEPIEVTLPLAAAGAWSPADAVVLAGCVGAGTSRTCTCPHTNFAASRKHAQALLEADPRVAGEILTMPEAITRGRDCFGGLLDHDAQEVPDVNADRT